MKTKLSFIQRFWIKRRIKRLLKASNAPRRLIKQVDTLPDRALIELAHKIITIVNGKEVA